MPWPAFNELGDLGIPVRRDNLVSAMYSTGLRRFPEKKLPF